MNNKRMNFLYHFCLIISRPLLRALFKFQIFGSENVPSTGGAMLMINHASYLDPIFIGGAVNRSIHYMARATLFKPGIIDKFLRSLNAFPVHLGSTDRSAIRNALKILDEGNLLLIFPEGTRSFDGTLGKAQDGIGFMAYRTQADVIPVYLSGTQKAWARGSKMIRTAKITVTFGKPLDMSIYRNSEASRETYSKIGAEVMARIAELKRDRESKNVGAKHLPHKH